MSKRKGGKPPGKPKGPCPAGELYDLGEWAEGEGTDLTNSKLWESVIGPLLGEDISAGKEYRLTTGQKINDVAVPNVVDPSFHVDLKVQERDVKPKTVLQEPNVLVKILLMRELFTVLGRWVPVVIVNPMGLRPAVRRDDPTVKGLWVRYRIPFLEDDGTSESVQWKEVVLEGVTTLLQLTEDALDELRELLEVEVANLDCELLERRLAEIETQLVLKIGRSFAKVSSHTKGIAFGEWMAEAEPEVQQQVFKKTVAEAEPEVQKQVIEGALAEAEPEVRQSVLETWSDAELEAELARRKAKSKPSKSGK